MTQLGLGSYACAWSIGIPGYEAPETPMGVLGLLHFAAELGLRRVQIADNLPLHSLDSGQRQLLRHEADARGIAVEVGTRGIQTDHLWEYIRIARFFGSSILRVVVDTPTHHPAPDEIVALIRGVLPQLIDTGITLAIENHDRFKAKTLAGIVTALDHPNVGICLDTVNSFGALEGPEIVVGTLGPHVVDLHLKEFAVRRASHNLGFEVIGLPAGQGMLDVPWLLHALRGFGRDFNAIIELWPAPEGTIGETVAKEMDWVRQSVAYLRTYIKD